MTMTTLAGQGQKLQILKNGIVFLLEFASMVPGHILPF